VSIEQLVRACGVRFCETGRPSDLPGFVSLLKRAVDFSRNEGPAVVIAKDPCRLDRRQKDSFPRRKTEVGYACNGCRYCVQQFECPALVFDENLGKVTIDRMICTDCGICIDVCPRHAFTETTEEEPKR
jgi:indolepyruvate ferredoxin oxidoreductase alpha subunit